MESTNAGRDQTVQPATPPAVAAVAAAAAAATAEELANCRDGLAAQEHLQNSKMQPLRLFELKCVTKTRWALFREERRRAG